MFFSKIIITLLSVIVVSGCVGTNKNTQTPANDTESSIQKTAIPSNSPFSKIKKDMGVNQVFDIIGHPTDQEAYVTGKAFIPFYMGSDTSQIVYYYKGMGQIYFTGGGAMGGGGRVIEVVYDPSEDGYR